MRRMHGFTARSLAEREFRWAISSHVGDGADARNADSPVVFPLPTRATEPPQAPRLRREQAMQDLAGSLQMPVRTFSAICQERHRERYT